MSSPHRPDVSVILVNYNDREHLGACLDSFRSEPSFPVREIILVDNASTDGSAQFAASRYPEVRILRNEANLGFSRANNQAAREARGGLLFFLNTDAALLPGALDVLTAALEKSPRAGAAGPALVRGPGRHQVSFGRRVDFAAQFVQKAVINPYRKIQLRFARKSRPVGWLSAAGLLCRAEAFAGVGGFDENFFIYFEDIDLCLRMRRAGWTILYVPESRVFHAGGATTAPRRARSRLEYRRSQLYFYEKHNSRASLGLLRAYLRTALTLARLRGGFRGAEGRSLRREYQAMLKRDGRRT
ncbi:MAG: glycosyltransferase family 2 protein [Candidatus Aminicenantes bacterium]|nr:glycosyltransferase family 2 protein [Candidatus Aminicenantes bacterium]